MKPQKAFIQLRHSARAALNVIEKLNMITGGTCAVH
jgi:hypothetical protein